MSRSRSMSAALAGGALVVAMTPVVARAAERTITLVGSLQDELGCAADWDPGCAATTLSATGPTTYGASFTLPAGSYQYKVAANGSWEENYGAGGAAGGANMAITVAGPASLRFSFDDVSHILTVTPTDLPGDTVTDADRALAARSLRADLTKERFYFVMTDRFANGDPTNDTGGLTGDRLATGLDPSDVGFYHGGDLRGIMDKLDYIKDLGTTSIWLTPSFANKAVQGSGADASAGYHGYWVTDFTRIDPHLGTNAQMKELITKAHAKGMKVFFDIITNHTADVIDYQEGQYKYIAKSDQPYKDANGVEFDDAAVANSPDFPALNAASFPYTPVFRDPADATAKTPAWLNDVTLYHNRGDSTFAGESSTYGDFIGLDDLFTEHPTVSTGMADIYKAWVDLGIDGFRIDTVKHVNMGFWQQFSPAVLAHAKATGNPDFFMFGEIYSGDPTYLSTFTKAGTLQAALDFGFQDAAVKTAKGAATKTLAELFTADDNYIDADSNAYQLPTFLGNHDMGRVGWMIDGSEDDKLARSKFAHALMYTLRGQPVVYYGDEQGFTGTGGDKAARQDMFASQSAQYNADMVLGGPEGSADRFSKDAVLYKHIAKLAELRGKHPGLADGAQINRFASDEAGVFAVSRIDRSKSVEYLVVANNDPASTKRASFTTATRSGKFEPIYGRAGDVRSDQQGNVTVSVPPLSVRVYRANQRVSPVTGPLQATFASPQAGGVVGGNAEIRLAVPTTAPVEVTYAFRPVGTTEWQRLGTDDNAPYRVMHDVTGLPRDTMVQYRAVVRDLQGNLTARSSYAIVGDPPAPPAGPGVDDVAQPGQVNIAGDLNSELGCPGDWQPECANGRLELDPNDNIWKGEFTLPAGDFAYKVAINSSWDENYGEGAVRNGGNISIKVPADNTRVRFYYDHRTHWVTSSLQDDTVVAVGDFQSEMGCPGDWDPGCMRAWLQDPDRDGVYSLATVQVPTGAFAGKVALNGSWDENYGAGGIPNGNNVAFSIAADGSVTVFNWDSASKVPTISVQPPPARPDLAVADAYWLDKHTIAYPLARIAAGTEPAALRYRVHWGELAIDANTLGGRSILATVVPGGPAGYLALRLPGWAPKPASMVPMVAVGVYSDADALLDATGVQGS